MKKIFISMIAVMCLSTIAMAQSVTDDNTAQELSALRKKLSRVQREMSLLMKDIVSNASALNGSVVKGFGGDVNVDILQNDKDIIVKADLPGMTKDKIDITLQNSKLLKISGSREMVREQSSQGVVKQERFSGQFEKIIELPCEVLNSGISATYKDGVLEMVIPKKAPAKEETVKINVK